MIIIPTAAICFFSQYCGKGFPSCAISGYVVSEREMKKDFLLVNLIIDNVSNPKITTLNYVHTYELSEHHLHYTNIYII